MGDMQPSLSPSSPSSDCINCCSLRKQLSELRQEIEELRKEFGKNTKQLKKAEFERESSANYVASLREQVSQLHEKLDTEKKNNVRLEESLKHRTGSESQWPSSGVNDGIAKDIPHSSNTELPAKDIASSIREAAEQATTSNGFVYDETSGLYYDYNTGYYYDPNTRLYYDYRKGIYYTYDTESGTYRFYSQVAITVPETEADGTDDGTKDDDSGKDAMKEKQASPTKIEIVESGSEDGEIIEVEDEENDIDVENEDDKIEQEEEFPPCIRAIVMQSDKIPVGSLNIVTCMGVTFGRMEGTGNFLRISDVEVSKEHAKIHYDHDNKQYFLTDLGSQNGTFVNGTRVSESKIVSEPRKLSHGEQLKLGSTTFLLHIHPGNETCDECEPGQVQAQLKAKEMQDEMQITGVGQSSTSTDSDTLRKKELRRLKKRYMLQNSDHEVNSEIASSTGGKYKDRAHVRRKKVGSDVLSDDLNDAPASVFKPIESENKGRLMLEKMGWIDGEGLGKTKSGRKEPVLVPLRETGCGLGYGSVKSIDTVSQSSKTIIWKKAQERYDASEIVDLVKVNHGKRKNEPVDIFADSDDRSSTPNSTLTI